MSLYIFSAKPVSGSVSDVNTSFYVLLLDGVRLWVRPQDLSFPFRINIKNIESGFHPLRAFKHVFPSVPARIFVGLKETGFVP